MGACFFFVGASACASVVVGVDEGLAAGVSLHVNIRIGVNVGLDVGVQFRCRLREGIVCREFASCFEPRLICLELAMLAVCHVHGGHCRNRSRHLRFFGCNSSQDIEVIAVRCSSRLARARVCVSEFSFNRFSCFVLVSRFPTCVCDGENELACALFADFACAIFVCVCVCARLCVCVCLSVCLSVCVRTSVSVSVSVCA